MDRIKEIYENLSVDGLKNAIEEVAEEHQTGVYKQDGVLRRVQKQVSEIIGNRYPIESVVNSITWELSKRWYNGFYGYKETLIND